MRTGRPTKMIPEVVSKLEQAFLMGCTDEEACVFADISRAALGRYEEKHPKFRDRKWTLKSNPSLLARQVILDALKNNDLATAHKVLDRKEGRKLAVTGRDDGPVQITKIERTIVSPPDRSGKSDLK